MGTPQAVQKQIDEAKEIQASLVADNNKPEALEVVAIDPANDTNRPEPVTDKPNDLGGDELKNDSDERLKSFRKMYDQKVHEFRIKDKEQSEKIDSLTDSIETLKAEQIELKDKFKAAAENQKADASKEELDDIKKQFGEDFVNAVSDLSSTQLIKQNASLNSRIENLETLLSKKSDNSKEPDEKNGNTVGFFSALNEHFPKWREVNGSQGFSDWLETPDSNGQPRKIGLGEAEKNGDAITVSMYFWDYQAEVPHRQTGGDYLPDASRGGETFVEKAQVITGDFIQQFYNDKLKGKYSSDEANAIEANINAAIRDNSVI